MKRSSGRPLVVAASLAVAAVVIGADTSPKPKPADAPSPTPPAGAAAAADANQVLATVNGEAIKSGEVDAEISQVLAQRGMPPNAIPAAERGAIVRRMLDQMITDKLVTQASAGVKIENAEVDSELEKIRQQNRITDEEITKQLAQVGKTLESLKADIKGQMQKRKWVEDQIKDKVQAASDTEAKEFYDKNPQHFQQPELVRASHILIKTAENAVPADITNALKKAEQAIERAKKEDFGKLAQELSEDPGSKARGGDLDFFPRNGRMVEPFAEAAFKLKKDEITPEPVRSQHGYHVIKVTDRKAASTQSFEEAKPNIVEFLGRERKGIAMQTVLQNLRDQAKVDIKLPPPAPPVNELLQGAPGAAAPQPKAAPKRQPVEAVTPPVSAPPPEPKKAPEAKKAPEPKK